MSSTGDGGQTSLCARFSAFLRRFQCANSAQTAPHPGPARPPAGIESLAFPLEQDDDGVPDEQDRDDDGDGKDDKRDGEP